jgi:hypothetical protein
VVKKWRNHALRLSWHHPAQIRFLLIPLTPPLCARYRSILESWQVVDLRADIAESAARLRASLRLKLAEAVQASAQATA